VAPVLIEGDVPAWLVLGYRENMDAARNPSRFSRDSRLWRDWNEGNVKPDSPLIPMVGWRPDCVSQDGEEHRRLRAAVNDSLARFDRSGVRRHIQRYADQLVDGFAADGEAELISRYADQLPMRVLTHLFGMAEEDGPHLVEACAGLIKGGEKALEYNEYVGQALSELATRKRAHPGHDFASWLIGHPALLTDDEVLVHLRLVLIAANETTTALIANTLRVVLTDPRFRASLTGGLMTVPDAVEQVLWDAPPLAVCPARFATADMEFGGRRVRAGDLLLLGLAAGNADPAVRPDPTTSMQGNRSHLAFSRGPHECPGQDIARAITDTAVDALLARLPDIHLSVPETVLSWNSSTWSRHLDTLPATFTPRRPAPPATATAPPPDPSTLPTRSTQTADMASATQPASTMAQRAPSARVRPERERQPVRLSLWRHLLRRLTGR
jgi:cytochrome P450